ncbi:preprotein translocase subunit SecY [Candidatus Saccharibacteria bacterium]|nr:preprotein translocase subunit SecY [Candidatus Saccharibacteria bacterium]
MHFKTIFKSFKNKDMLKRIGIVLGILVVYRFLAHIPVPMGDATTFKDAMSNLISKSDFGNFINLISGGGLANFSIILVGMSPYITASIISQLMTKAIPRLEELSEDGETGRRKINQWTRILSVPLAIVQSIAYCYILFQSMGSYSTTAFTPTFHDWFLAVTAMSAGSIILMWLGELITEQGIGNGISTIIFLSIVSQFQTTASQLGSALFDTSQGSLSLFGWLNLPVNPTVFWILLGFGLALIIAFYFLVKINEAQRIIEINYAKRIHTTREEYYRPIKSILPIKLIAAGVIPVIFATAFLSLPALVGQFMTSANPDNQVGQTLVHVFTAPSSQNFSTMYPDGITAQWFIYPALYFILVVMFTYFYTSIIFNTKEIADNLQKQGGFIEGVRPGLSTAKFLDRTVIRLNFFGSLTLGFIAMIPFVTDYIFIMLTGQPLGLSISGTGLLIVVTVALENLRSLDSRALMVTYDDYK